MRDFRYFKARPRAVAGRSIKTTNGELSMVALLSPIPSEVDVVSRKPGLGASSCKEMASILGCYLQLGLELSC